MAGDGVLFAWEDADVQWMIRNNIARIDDMTPVMKSYAEYLVNRTDERFRDEVDPEGNDWQELQPATVARKKAQGKIDKILQQDGYLRLVHPDADRKSAGVYSEEDYAAIHNRGGQAGRNLSVTIPKREFLGINDEDVREFQESIKDWVVLGRAA